MKRTIFIIVILIVSNLITFGQGSIDKVNIYIIPFNTSIFAESGTNANYVRVRSKYSFSITDKHFINELVAKYKSISKEVIGFTSIEKVNGSRLVIDFISSSQIIESIVIHSAYTMTFDEPYTKVKIYKYDKNFICYLNGLFPTIVEVATNDFNCSE